MTETASVPERMIQISPQIIDEISRAIAAATTPADLREWGRTLQQLLIPSDLNGQLFSSAAPLVMALDATMARVPWELLTLPNCGTELPLAEQLLGLATGYGVTRQLQTPFANLPERNRSTAAGLSVIVIADPAPDASLPGAYREAKWVEEFFRVTFPGSRVVCLEGPEATRAKLAKELCNHSYDVLHFAGHCHFNAEQPGKSGWIFRREPLQVFSADELLRLDRVPPFVFSNACQSGVTPDRAHEANPAVGPAFAEAFFAKGVSNFICTGWPVDDRAALAFAKRFYQEMFINHATMQQAMLLARQEISAIGWQTVGAYQHYGNPFHTFRPKPAEDVTKAKPAANPKSPRK
jgi:CHAT domain-containing protein